MARVFALLLMAGSGLLSPQALAQHIHNNGTKTACINNQCKRRPLTQRYFKVDNANAGKVIRDMDITYKNDFTGIRNPYIGLKRSDCLDGFEFKRAASGEGGVCSPRRVLDPRAPRTSAGSDFIPVLNTRLSDALDEQVFDDTLALGSVVSGSEVSNLSRTNIEAAKRTLTEMDQRRDPLIQIGKLKESANFQAGVEGEEARPQNKAALMKRTMNLVNQSFQQADLTPIDQDMFSNTFQGSGPRLKKRAVDANLLAR